MDTHTAFDEFLTFKVASGRAKRTLQDYHRCIGYALTWLAGAGFHTTGALTRQAVRSYVAALRSGEWSEGTIGLYVRNLRTWLNWLHAEQYTDENLAAAIPAPGIVVSDRPAPPPDLLRRLVAACSGDNLALRDRALILLMASTGLRRGEIVLLERQDVHLADAWLRAYTPKTSSYRFAFLTPEAQAALQEYLSTRSDDHPALFMGRSGKPLGYHGIYQVIRRRAESAGIDPKRVNPHSFRVFLATEWMISGGDEERLLKLMGWKSPRMLEIYVRAGRRDDLQDAHDKYAPRLFED